MSSTFRRASQSGKFSRTSSSLTWACSSLSSATVLEVRYCRQIYIVLRFDILPYRSIRVHVPGGGERGASQAGQRGRNPGNVSFENSPQWSELNPQCKWFVTNKVCVCHYCVMDSPDSDNFMEHFTNENDNGYAWLNVNPLMFSIFRIISSSPSECKLLLSCLPRRVFFSQPFQCLIYQQSSRESVGNC